MNIQTRPQRRNQRTNNQGDVEKNAFEEKIVQVSRVSKKTKGGNRIGFSVVAVVGDKKGRVAVGLGKAPEVQDAIRKATNYAKKRFITVPLKGTTIPHAITVKLGAAIVMLKPAPVGTGVIAGGAVRSVLEAAGVRDVVSKALGTSNKASNVYATLYALEKIRELTETKRIMALDTAEGKIISTKKVDEEKV